MKSHKYLIISFNSFLKNRIINKYYLRILVANKT